MSTLPLDDTLDFLVAFQRGLIESDDAPMQELLTRRTATTRRGDRRSRLRPVPDQEPRHGPTDS